MRSVPWQGPALSADRAPNSSPGELLRGLSSKCCAASLPSTRLGPLLAGVLWDLLGVQPDKDSRPSLVEPCPEGSLCNLSGYDPHLSYPFVFHLPTACEKTFVDSG